MSTLYKNTGVARASKLVIHRKVDGVDITGFPVVYDLLTALAGYPAITLAEFKKLNETDYIARRDAFIAKAASDLSFMASTDGSIVTDVTACPISGYVTP